MEKELDEKGRRGSYSGIRRKMATGSSSSSSQSLSEQYTQQINTERELLKEGINLEAYDALVQKRIALEEKAIEKLKEAHEEVQKIFTQKSDWNKAHSTKDNYYSDIQAFLYHQQEKLKKSREIIEEISGYYNWHRT